MQLKSWIDPSESAPLRNQLIPFSGILHGNGVAHEFLHGSVSRVELENLHKQLHQIRRPASDSEINLARRFCRVSSRFALMIHQLAIF